MILCQRPISSHLEVVAAQTGMLTSSATSLPVAGLCATPLLAKQAIQTVAQHVTEPEIVLLLWQDQHISPTHVGLWRDGCALDLAGRGHVDVILQ